MTCAHYWEIATPDGPTSLGVCKLCGEERVHDNSMIVVDADWKASGAKGAAAKKAQAAVREAQKAEQAQNLSLPLFPE